MSRTDYRAARLKELINSSIICLYDYYDYEEIEFNYEDGLEKDYIVLEVIPRELGSYI